MLKKKKENAHTQHNKYQNQSCIFKKKILQILIVENSYVLWKMNLNFKLFAYVKESFSHFPFFTESLN